MLKNNPLTSFHIESKEFNSTAKGYKLKIKSADYILLIQFTKFITNKKQTSKLLLKSAKLKRMKKLKSFSEQIYKHFFKIKTYLLLK